MTASVPLLLNLSSLTFHAGLCWQFVLLQTRVQSFFCHHHYTAVQLVDHSTFFTHRFTSQASYIILVFMPGFQKYFGSPSRCLPKPISVLSQPAALFISDLWTLLNSVVKVIACLIIQKMNSIPLCMFTSTNAINAFPPFSCPFFSKTLAICFLLYIAHWAFDLPLWLALTMPNRSTFIAATRLLQKGCLLSTHCRCFACTLKTFPFLKTKQYLSSLAFSSPPLHLQSLL